MRFVVVKSSIRSGCTMTGKFSAARSRARKAAFFRCCRRDGRQRPAYRRARRRSRGRKAAPEPRSTQRRALVRAQGAGANRRHGGSRSAAPSRPTIRFMVCCAVSNRRRRRRAAPMFHVKHPGRARPRARDLRRAPPLGLRAGAVDHRRSSRKRAGFARISSRSAARLRRFLINSRAFLSPDVCGEKRQRGRRHAIDAAGLAERARPDRRQLLAHFHR